MNAKEPVLLVVLIETGTLRWYVAGVSLAGHPLPLMRSETGSLGAYIDVAFDEQVSFLRHRLAGVLQRGCDRLWGHQKKPCQIVIVADHFFPQAPLELTQHVADHFVQWMVNPPVAFVVTNGSFRHNATSPLEPLAGQLEPSHREALEAGLPKLLAAVQRDELWEVSQSKRDAEFPKS